MTIHFSSASRIRLFATILTTAFVVTLSHGAYAVEGCNPAVERALQAKAQAKVAYDVAVTEQIVDKPDSVLAMTCFNEAAGVSAADGGSIFSGDFTTDLQPLIENALTAFYDDYADSTGDESGVVDYAATTLSATYDCDEMDELWDEISSEGVEDEVPFVTFDDLMTAGTPAGAGTDFDEDWQAPETQAVVTELTNSMADPFFTAPTIPTSAGDSSCQALVDYGVIPGPCP